LTLRGWERRRLRIKTKDEITPTTTSAPITIPAIAPEPIVLGLADIGVMEEVGVGELVTVELVAEGRFVNSAEAALEINDSAASLTL